MSKFHQNQYRPGIVFEYLSAVRGGLACGLVALEPPCLLREDGGINLCHKLMFSTDAIS